MIRNTLRVLYLLATLLTIACNNEDLPHQDQDKTTSACVIEPDYEQLINDLGIDAALIAIRTKDDLFVETESAGSIDTVNWFRTHLSHDNSIFLHDEEIEGISIVGSRLRIDQSSGGSARVHTLSIIDGRCTINRDFNEVSLCPKLLIEALRNRQK